MPLQVPGAEGNCLYTGILGDDDSFVIESAYHEEVVVPPEWRVPLAAHLIAGTKIFHPTVVSVLNGLATRLEKKRGKKNPQDLEDAKFLRALSNAMQHLMQEYLEADPGTSTRFEYRPEYYEQRLRRLRKEGKVPPAEPDPPPPPPIDAEPAPWEM